MKLLMLGGTVFAGRHLVDAALARGHEVTLFNRGQHNSELFPGLERLRGDRDGDLSALEGRRWDAVVDTPGYVPRIVRASAELLAGSIEHYTFISSISVYADTSRPRMDESAPVGRLDDPLVEEVNGKTYGPLKALCEAAVEAELPGRALVVRPGLIVGPHDPTDRFTYWPHRVALGGDVLAPGRPERPVQIIDARDMAEWLIGMIETRQTGIFNATGPASALTMRQVLDSCRHVSGSDARLHWATDEFLLASGVTPWTELPLWLPESEENAGFFTVDCGRAIAPGLRFRPLDETVRDTLAWDATRPPDVERTAGLKAEREQELLTAWQAAAGNP